MIGGVLSEIDFGDATCLDYLCRSRVAKTLQVLSLRFSKLAIDLRVPSAFLFRGYAGANTDYWIDPRKPNEQTIVELHLCCFGSRTFSPCTLVFQGCSREWLGNFAFEHNLRCHGRHGFFSFRPGHKHLETGLVSRVKKTRSSVAIPAFSRFCPYDGRICHLRNEMDPQFQKYKRPSCTPR